MKSAINSRVVIPPYQCLGDHPTIKKFFKGIFNLRPPQPKLSFVWDVKLVFDHFRDMPSNEELSDKQLTHKLVMLLLLLGGQRLNTIHNYSVNKMIITTTSVTFAPEMPLKHSKTGRKMDVFLYRAYEERKLCVVKCIIDYVRRRGEIEDTQLLITYGKPRKPASIDTIRRWVKELFKEVNIVDFTPHSCRSASTSKALQLNIDIEAILKQGCWKNEDTFLKFYNKDIVHKAPDATPFDIIEQ